ncbi:MAG: MBOAT family O-acyltransferase [Myxococcota bacterium]|nr:MBOAT family O-acyltransferase [Myxococcota bacterium]
MHFASIDYLIFLPLVVLVYWGLPRSSRLSWLALASLGFYASWNWVYLPLLVATIAFAWMGGLWMAKLRRSGGVGLSWVVLGLLLPLFLFKYANWVAASLEQVLPVRLGRIDAELPLGISFFTFQAIAYVVDIRRGRDAERNPVHFASFLSFFPQLISGPIVRVQELLPQLKAQPWLQPGDVGEALYRIGMGVTKKLVFADSLRLGIVSPVFTDPSQFTGIEIAIALYAYTLQIYCDFSGYMDIAIGSGRLFGFRLPENFDRPYQATSVAEFWRRWHITLSNWVRDYVYFGLGGARTDREWKVYRNLILTMVVIGLWHKASWTLVLYGALHGVALGINRYRRKRSGRRPGASLSSVWGWGWRFLLTFHFIVLARILFRSENMAMVGEVLEGLTGAYTLAPRFSPLAMGLLALGFLLHFSPLRWDRRLSDVFRRGGPGLWTLGLSAVAVVCILFGSEQALAFEYYQF